MILLSEMDKLTGATVAVAGVSYILVRQPQAQQAVTEKLSVLLIIVWVLAYSLGARPTENSQ